MHGAVLIAVALLFIALSISIGLFALVRRRILLHHRVDPTISSPVPLTWAVDPRAPARLHRRLARIGDVTIRLTADDQPRRGRRRHRDEPTPLQQTALAIRQQAVALDRRLDVVAALPLRVRRDQLIELGRAVDDLEGATAQLARLHEESGDPRTLTGQPSRLEAVIERVDLLERAHAELQRIDRDHGLEPDPLARRVERSPGTDAQ